MIPSVLLMIGVIALYAAVGLVWVEGHSDDPLPDAWYDMFRETEQYMISSVRNRSKQRRLGKGKDWWPFGPHQHVDPVPMPTPVKAQIDPGDEVHFLVLGDWGTFPGAGAKHSKWNPATWEKYCFQGSSSREEWEALKKYAEKHNLADPPKPKWGNGYPICGSMHLECSWDKGGAAKGPRCDPDQDWFWRDHEAQANVAKHMGDHARQVHPSFVINTGDNFYYWGVTSTTDITWQYMYEEIYDDEALHIPWLGSLGNHDYGGHECDTCLWPTIDDGTEDPRRDKPCSKSMFEYDTDHSWQHPSPKASRWVMPMTNDDRWYTKSFKFPKAGITIDAFVIDTNKAHTSSMCHGQCPKNQARHCEHWFMNLWMRQKKWLLSALEASTATWKVVVGHAPPDGNIEEALMDDMRDRGVALYMCGHVHTLRYDAHPSGIAVIVSGAGGGYQTAGGGNAYTQHQTNEYGFASVKATPTELVVTYVNDLGAVLWDPIHIPIANDATERILKKLRAAAGKSDVAKMKDEILRGKKQNVSEDALYAAAMTGALAMQMNGGMVYVHMTRKLVPADVLKMPGAVAEWIDAGDEENALPKGKLELVYDHSNREGCGSPSSAVSGKVALFFAGPSCTASEVASLAAQAGAVAVLYVAQPNGDLTGAGSDTDTASLPMVTIPFDHVVNVPAWLGNPAEVITAQILNGDEAAQQACDDARAAGVPDSIAQKTMQDAIRRQATEALETAQSSNDIQAIQKALNLADKAGVETDQVEDCKERLQLLKCTAQLNKYTDIKDYNQMVKLVQWANDLQIQSATLKKATYYKKHLAADQLMKVVTSGKCATEGTKNADFKTALHACVDEGVAWSTIEEWTEVCREESSSVSAAKLGAAWFSYLPSGLRYLCAGIALVFGMMFLSALVVQCRKKRRARQLAMHPQSALFPSQSSQEEKGAIELLDQTST